MSYIEDYWRPMLGYTVALTAGALVAGWAGFAVALFAVIVGGVGGAYTAFVEVDKRIKESIEEFDEREFPIY